MTGKGKAQKAHAKRRAMERFGVELTNKKFAAIVELIQGQKAKFLDRQSGHTTRWLIELEGREVIVVYDSKRHTLVTFLHKEIESIFRLNSPLRIVENNLGKR